MKFGSLFSGIGGLDLGLERAGMSCVWQSEIDPYACKVLTKHWPDIPNHGDITQIDWHNVEPVDLLCGGFPCQDISNAGRRAGIHEGTRSGLWYQYLGAIRVLRPRYVIIENVAALLIRGLDIVCSGLSKVGYDAEWEVIRASDLGCIHQRSRLFIIAYPNGQGGPGLVPRGSAGKTRPGGWCSKEDLQSVDPFQPYNHWPKPLLRRSHDDLSDRVDRLKCLGNAVVPQVAEYVGRCIMDHVSAKTSHDPHKL